MSQYAASFTKTITYVCLWPEIVIHNRTTGVLDRLLIIVVSDRGLIPRSISYIFKSFTNRSEYVHTVHISYMEIYNSQAYDLLDPSREVNQMSDLPAVTILEDDEGRYHMRNLSLHPCVSCAVSC
jgi:hypothetical protein